MKFALFSHRLKIKCDVFNLARFWSTLRHLGIHLPFFFLLSNRLKLHERRLYGIFSFSDNRFIPILYLRYLREWHRNWPSIRLHIHQKKFPFINNKFQFFTLAYEGHDSQNNGIYFLICYNHCYLFVPSNIGFWWCRVWFNVNVTSHNDYWSLKTISFRKRIPKNVKLVKRYQ